MTARLSGLAPWLAFAAIRRRAAHFSVGDRADDDEPHGRHDHLRLVLQYAARADRPALVRACGLLRAWRLRRHPRDERRHPRQARRVRSRHSSRRRIGRARLRRPVRPRFDPSGGARLLDDLARHRRARVVELVHPAHLLRRRGGDHHQPGEARAVLRAQVRAADRGLLSHRDLVLRLRARDVCADPHAVRAHVQRGARQSRAGRIRRLFARGWCASSPSVSRRSSPGSPAGSRRSISRS